MTLGHDWPIDFETLVKEHSARLVRSLTLITLDRGLAEDAAQEAFLQLYMHWHDGEVRDRVAWLYRVGINKCKDYRRTIRRAAQLGERLSRGAAEPLRSSWFPESRFIEILRLLAKRQRTAAALFYLAGFSTAEIAQAMDITEGAVSSHLHKARESLRKVLEEE